VKRLVVLGLLLAGAGLQVQAQAVWRCGVDGRTFSDRPCAEGLPMKGADLADTRSAAEVQSAHEVAARERRLADSLRQARLEREHQAAPPSRLHAAARGPDDRQGVRPAREAKQARPKSQRRAPADDGIWRAAVPSSPRKKD